MLSHLTPAEHWLLATFHKLRVCGYIGTAADLYTRLTGRQHPRARGEAS